VNIGNPDERTLLELAEIVKRITGASSEIVFEALRIDDPMQRKPDITRAQQLLGWEPEISLEEGLSRLLREQGREAIRVGAERLLDGRRAATGRRAGGVGRSDSRGRAAGARRARV